MTLDFRPLFQGNKIRYIVMLALVGFLPSCTTESVYNGKKEVGSWETKAQVKDLKNKKTYQVGLDIIGTWPQELRLDVSGSMGVALATIVLNKKEIHYALYRQKKFYEGSLSDRALYPMFHINLNPKYLLNVCFDQPIHEKGWTCTQDAKGLVAACQRKSDGLNIEWKDRDQEKKRAILTGEGFEVQIVFKSFSTKVRSDQDPYHLEPPNTFTRYKIL